MRTGGDDIAQAMAFMGAKPTWSADGARAIGFEILSVESLGRPRIDVTLRASGFFRDAFPWQIGLLDRAARAIGALDEPPSDNPLAESMRLETERPCVGGGVVGVGAADCGFADFFVGARGVRHGIAGGDRRERLDVAGGVGANLSRVGSARLRRARERRVASRSVRSADGVS